MDNLIEAFVSFTIKTEPLEDCPVPSSCHTVQLGSSHMCSDAQLNDYINAVDKELERIRVYCRMKEVFSGERVKIDMSAYGGFVDREQRISPVHDMRVNSKSGFVTNPEDADHVIAGYEERLAVLWSGLGRLMKGQTFH